MAYQNGTATDYRNLLNIFQSFATGSAGWTILDSTTGGDIDEYYFRTAGLSGTEQIYMGIRTEYDVVNDVYNWELMGSLGYDDTKDFYNQPLSRYDIFLPLWNFSIPYWIIGNADRIIMVAKISTVYVTLYMGRFLPYATPSQYPYPLMISGTMSTERALSGRRWSEELLYNSGFQNPTYATYFFAPDNTWHQVRNKYQSTSEQWDTGTLSHLMPTSYGCFGANSGGFQNMLPCQDGSFITFPYLLGGPNIPEGNFAGEISGLLWVTGNANASENTFSQDGKNYMVFQNVHRTSWHDYFALELA